MRVSKLSIRNVLGIESLDITPGAVTVISGGNGTGKTSVMEAIKSVVNGGSDATLVRKGQEAGEVVILLDNGMEIRKRIGQSRSPVTVKNGEGQKLPEPQSVIAQLMDSVSANPVAFLTAPAAKRAEMLLDILPWAVTEQDLIDCGCQPWMKDLSGPMRLDVIDQLRKRVYDDRTGLNRVVKEQRAAAAALTSSTPEGTQESVAAELASVDAELSRKTVQIATANAELRTAIERKRNELGAEYRAGIEGIRQQFGSVIEDLERKLAEVRREMAAAEAELQRIGSEVLAEATEELRKATSDAVAQLEVDALAFSNRKSLLAERLTAHTRAAEALRIAKQSEDKATDAERQSEKASRVIDALDALKQKALANLPIPGAEVRDGDIFIGGINFDRLNSSKRVGIALRVAKLLAGEVGLVAVDNLECLDPNTFAAFERSAVKSGLQFIVTRVTEGPLKVEVTA